ncbi:MAG: hypothetical protein ACKO0Z_10335 [Betaproteobacteria bacterium]
MTEREALKLITRAIEEGWSFDRIDAEVYPEIKRALAQPEQEPVAFMFQHDEVGRCVFSPNDSKDPVDTFLQLNPRYHLVGPLYTTPPQRQPLTDEQIAVACGWMPEKGCKPLPNELKIARAIEAAHGIKGEA